MQEVQQYFDLSDTWTDYDGYIHDGTDLLWYFSEGGSKNLITSPTAYAKAHGAYDSNVYHDAEGNPTCYWWLRTPGDDSDSAVCINSAGGVDPDGDFIDNDNNAVRPALWVNLAS
ncbi:MAG: hypothetical protein J6S83_00260, partial [Lachnospiraceae bacterium]|nr:hypothetical protein [Lachnospiraceae bacterium]